MYEYLEMFMAQVLIDILEELNPDKAKQRAIELEEILKG